jgi:hypothetical protein
MVNKECCSIIFKLVIDLICATLKKPDTDCSALKDYNLSNKY